MNASITKRDFVLGGVGAASLIVAGTGGFIAKRQDLALAALALYDSRLPLSRRFMREAGAAHLTALDIADEERNLWRSIRALSAASTRDAVRGVTRWSDWTIVRGALEGQGRRVRREFRVECQPDAAACEGMMSLFAASARKRAFEIKGPASGSLFGWEMA